MTQAALHRSARLALLLAVAYALALWSPVRAWYSDVDKLAHGLVFAGVYVALARALRWKPWALVPLAAALGAAVEVHQFFLPGFSASLKDWLADVVGIGLACGAHQAWRCRRAHGEAPVPGVRLPLVPLSPSDMAPLALEDTFFTPPSEK